MKNINVMSLFDGMSGGRLAFQKAGIHVENYYSSEIDKYAIQIADKNFPQDTVNRLGSVIDLTEEQLLALPKIDILIGGSPCQGFSMAGTKKGSSTECGIDVTTLDQYLTLKSQNFAFNGQSYLFWEYVRILHILKPKYFFLENVRITKKWLPMFNGTLGVEPISINSNLMSAQNRPRFYWTNIPDIKMPEDKNIQLKDILETNESIIGAIRGRYITNDGKTTQVMELNKTTKPDCLTTASKDNAVICDSIRPGVAENIARDHQLMTSDKNTFNMKCASGFQDNKIGIKKSPCLRASNSGTYILNGYKYRRLTVIECERLQTVPDNYTEGVSTTQRKRMLGNGWTIDVIAHMFKNIK